MVGAPTFRNLKIMIRNNIIHNLPVTVEDIDIAEIIFGPDVYTLKGTKMRQRPKLVVEDFIEIPKELIQNNQYLNMCMDIMFINKQALLTKIDKYILFCGLFPLVNITKET